MADGVRPLFLFADSQLLFWRPAGRPFLARLAAALPAREPRAAYIGVSNGDDPTFYALFEAAMDLAGIHHRRHLGAAMGAADRRYLDTADLVLLSGGDVVRGFRALESNGLREALARRYLEGQVLAGVSAGAVQLGWLAHGGDEPATSTLLETLKLVPAVIGVHEEQDQWRHLHRLLRLSDLPIRGLGIPAGGGLIYHPDQSVEPVRHPVQEIAYQEGRWRSSLLFPPAGDPTEPARPAPPAGPPATG
jgi:hypothetical protein